MLRMLLVLITVLASTGCAVKKDYYAMTGSRADGTVDMAYDFRQFEKPIVNQDQAYSIAKQKCGVWGYSDAEAFGGMRQNCHQRDNWGTCLAGQIVVQYQCIGSGQTAYQAPAAVQAPARSSSQLMPESAYRQRQLDALMQQDLPYEQYQRRYREIMGE
ncbi:YecR family lipoprotein [Pseudomonas segetis]